MSNIIHKTTDYAQFKFVKGNRRPAPQYLIDSIQKCNMLDTHPIICDKDMNVMDGQNRLEAARTLGIPIFYIISDEISSNDIPLCQVQNPWNQCNFLDYYKQTNRNYMLLDEIYMKLSLPLTFLINCASSQTRPMQAFREGKFAFSKNPERTFLRLDMVKEAYERIKKIYQKTSTKPFYLNRNSLEALWQLTGQADYDHVRFLTQCENYNENILDSFDFRTVAKILESINNKVYNFRRHQKKD